MTDDLTKLEGHRAIREHIEKYKRYQRDKDFAVKTIRNCQEQIKKLRAKHPN